MNLFDYLFHKKKTYFLEFLQCRVWLSCWKFARNDQCDHISIESMTFSILEMNDYMHFSNNDNNGVDVHLNSNEHDRFRVRQENGIGNEGMIATVN